MIPFREAVKVWWRVALMSFGGPAGQIAVMHRILVEEKKWISESRFLHALNYCMMLPGPEAQQMATYMGWLLHRTKGGLVAGGLFVLPGFLAILILSIIYALYRELALVDALFFGIKPAVLAIVVGAVIKIGHRALKNRTMVLIAVLAFIAIFFFAVPFPILVLAAGITGLIGGFLRSHVFVVAHPTSQAMDDTDMAHLHVVQPHVGRAVRTALVWLVIWFSPVLLVWRMFGAEHVFVQEAVVFSKVAVVTFGGAYAVLSYIAQLAVEVYGWLEPGEMLDGLGMAETTPGPLIMVLQFVGFMGAFRFPGELDPLTAGIIGSVLVTWVTFAPCFLFVFTGAPFIEALRGNRHLTAALSGITAAVVGVILNLGIWFGINVWFNEVDAVHWGALRIWWPTWDTLDPLALALSMFAMVVYLKLKWSLPRTLLVCAALGMGLRLFL